MNEYSCRTAVVFVFFNRVEPMKKVLGRIREVKPKTLYFISDGPRNEEEKIRVDECRRVAEGLIDWDCTLIKDYADKNMGCKYRVYSGISYALEKEDCVIVLEDDCFPSVSFFQFQDEMLEKYKDNKEVMMVSGNNRLSDVYHTEQDYLFTWFPSIWGWGTWRDAWENVDIEMSDWEENRKNFKCRPYRLRYLLKKQYDQIYYGGLDTWDYQWRYARHMRRGVGIAPAKNLIRNIGFSEDATHTKRAGRFDEIMECEMMFPLKYQDRLETDLHYDRLYIKNFYKKGFYKRLAKDTLKKILCWEHLTRRIRRNEK